MSAAVAGGRTAIALLRAAHPEPAIVVTVVTAALAWGVGTASATVALLTVAVVLGQASVGWSNDWLDAVRGLDEGRRDKPLAHGALEPDVVRRAALASLAAATVVSLLLGLVPGLLHIGAIGLAWAYNVRFKATPFSIASYIGAFALLPVVVTTAAGLGWPRWWAVLAGGCFGAGVHLANALPDLDRDRAQGIGGLPQRLGPRRATLAAVALLGAGAVAALGPGLPAAAAWLGLLGEGLLLGAVVAAERRGRRRLAFRLTMVCGLVVVGALVAQGARIVGGG